LAQGKVKEFIPVVFKIPGKVNMNYNI